MGSDMRGGGDAAQHDDDGTVDGPLGLDAQPGEGQEPAVVAGNRRKFSSTRRRGTAPEDRGQGHRVLGLVHRGKNQSAPAVS